MVQFRALVGTSIPVDEAVAFCRRKTINDHRSERTLQCSASCAAAERWKARFSSQGEPLTFTAVDGQNGEMAPGLASVKTVKTAAA
jgi:hypothetical protein